MTKAEAVKNLWWALAALMLLLAVTAFVWNRPDRIRDLEWFGAVHYAIGVGVGYWMNTALRSLLRLRFGKEEA